MSGKWAGSDRSSRLPRDWQRRRLRVLMRDGRRCVWVLPSGLRCPAPATDVDHIVPGDDHSLDNLRSLCRAHHAHKSAGEGAAASIIARRKPAEKHPGLL